MPNVSWTHLQYGRERRLYAKIRPLFERLRQDYKDFSRKTQFHEREFFNCLSHSIRIDKHPSISGLIDQLTDKLELDTEITLFLFHSPSAEAKCMPRYGFLKKEESRRLVILVSQHFLNVLSEAERMSILGHELGHLLFGHVDIPAKTILEGNFALEDAKSIKSDVLMWMTCAEISCDLVGLYCCDGNSDAFCSGMIKYVTGLDHSIISDKSLGVSFLDLSLGQFEEISDSLHDAHLESHPLTPLRLKIVRSVKESSLFRSLGEEVDRSTLNAMCGELNTTVDDLIGKIYPEIIPEENTNDKDTAFLLCLAVALSDGRITKEEIMSINEILGKDAPLDRTQMKIVESLRKRASVSIVQDLVQEVVGLVKEQGLPRRHLVRLLRQALVVAGSDQRIERVELETVYAFAKNFAFSKDEIVAIVAQTNLG